MRNLKLKTIFLVLALSSAMFFSSTAFSQPVGDSLPDILSAISNITDPAELKKIGGIILEIAGRIGSKRIAEEVTERFRKEEYTDTEIPSLVNSVLEFGSLDAADSATSGAVRSGYSASRYRVGQKIITAAIEARLRRLGYPSNLITEEKVASMMDWHIGERQIGPDCLDLIALFSQIREIPEEERMGDPDRDMQAVKGAIVLLISGARFGEERIEGAEALVSLANLPRGETKERIAVSSLFFRGEVILTVDHYRRELNAALIQLMETAENEGAGARQPPQRSTRKGTLSSGVGRSRPQAVEAANIPGASAARAVRPPQEGTIDAPPPSTTSERSLLRRILDGIRGVIKEVGKTEQSRRGPRR